MFSFLIKTRYSKLREELQRAINRDNPDIHELIDIVYEYEKRNLETIEKLKRKKIYENKRISGALKQTINAHSVITKKLIGSATKRIYGALLENKKSKKEMICEKISSIYHTFVFIMIFIIKLEFMKTNKEKICVTISKENNEKLISDSVNKSKLIDKLLTEYFKNK